MPTSSIASDTHRLIEELTSGLEAAAAEFVPWFRAQMPESYFRNVDPAARLEHMRAILALRASGQEPRMRIRSNDGRRITYVLPNDYPGMLIDLMEDIGDELIRSAKLYSSRDRALVIDIFEMGQGPRCDLTEDPIRRKFDQTVALGRERAGPWNESALRTHFARLSRDYVIDCAPNRILSHADLFEQAHESSGSAVVVDNSLYPDMSRVVLAVANAPAKRMLVRVASLFKSLKINIIRAYVDAIQAGEEESVVIISAVVQGPAGGKIEKGTPLYTQLNRDLLRLKWLDQDTLTLGFDVSALGLGGADILHTLCDLTSQLLVKTNRYVYSRTRIREIAQQHLEISTLIVDLFKDRFDPVSTLDDADHALRDNKIRDRIDDNIEDEVAHTVLTTMLLAVASTLKTNFYVDGRYALSLRLAPELMMTASQRPETPFGVFWVHGRNFNAFHVRFRDTARGGVRVVRPNSAEQFMREAERHFDEVYDLAYAQQLKNKDIPEGGAKAVILVEPDQTITRCVRAFADAMLDLITSDPNITARIVDRYGKPEFIYFGPDENITPDHITWIVNRARQRSYRFPNAVMSSKPGAGINHKEYGVTSEGVNVFLEVALNAVGINPRTQPFTVKITGGPDGDVAGNAMRIFIREYGPNVRIVGIADGFGCAEDPDGLDHTELLRLVKSSLPISQFTRARLSPRGRLTLVTDPDGVKIRNEMHNRVLSDAFVPAGGRPATINASNAARFLGHDGRPSSRLIVEGANLFLTGEARQKLFEAGVLIVKDSSANKCGVVCSSYEVLACLMLSEDEFLEIKPHYVQQVLERLRDIARREAVLLFDEHRRRPNTSLVDLSIRLSREIIRLNDALRREFPSIASTHPDLVRETLLAYIPSLLLEKAGGRVWTTLPEDYRREIVCAGLASRIVYREGLDYFADVPDDRLAPLVIAYVQRERRTNDLIAEIHASSLPNKTEIAELLRIAGTRAALQADSRRKDAS